MSDDTHPAIRVLGRLCQEHGVDGENAFRMSEIAQELGKRPSSVGTILRCRPIAAQMYLTALLGRSVTVSFRRHWSDGSYVVVRSYPIA